MLSDMKNYQNMSEKNIRNMFIQSRIIKYQNHIKIYQFWDYFENFIKKFRGISNDNFFYYLKESEFRYNNFSINLSDLEYFRTR